MTPNTLLKETIGLSTDMARYYTKGYFNSIGESIKYSSGMELNGSTEGVLQFIIEKTNDNSIREKAKAALNGTNGTNHESPIANMRNRTERKITERNGTNGHERKIAELNEQNETERKELLLRIEAERNEAERIRIMNEDSERKIAEQEKQIAELENTIQGLKNSIARIAKEQADKAGQWFRDIGDYILSAPNAKFLFVLILVSAQACLFAMLEDKVLTDLGIGIPFWSAFVVGILFEASGFMIARQFPPAEKWQGMSTRDWWLVIFFGFQCVTNLCLFVPLSAESVPLIAGRIMISLAVPIGLLAYSFLYFQRSNNEV